MAKEYNEVDLQSYAFMAKGYNASIYNSEN